ncbi:MAG: transposase [Candidatus Komeilibacteria bacterium]
MVTKQRNIQPENYYHVYNRAVNKNNLFITEEDYYGWQRKVYELQDITKVIILAWAYLPNHYHYLLKEPNIDIVEGCKFRGSAQSSISQFISRLENSYTKYFSMKYDHSGVIFQGQYKSILIDSDDYLQYLIYYINLNPIKHNIVSNINDWTATSHHDYLDYSKNKIISSDDLINFNLYKKNHIQYVKNYQSLENKVLKYLP